MRLETAHWAQDSSHREPPAAGMVLGVDKTDKKQVVLGLGMDWASVTLWLNTLRTLHVPIEIDT